MTPAEQALKIWTYAQRAAIGLSMLADQLPGQWPQVQLGSSLSEELVRELARIAGSEPQVYRFQGEDSLEWVRFAFVKRIDRVEVEGFGQRPATSADASLPRRGGRA